MTTSLPPLAALLADRYRIEREVGRGGMATVYLAQDLKHHRHVAVKVLRPDLAAVLGAERFLKEIEVTAGLQHPNILALYDSGEAGGFLYYVMPFVEGESLRGRLEREKQLPIEEALRIADAVGAALQFAHERGVIHRDIKPENILLHAGQALVADFGIALAISQAGGSRLTETGLSLGTPHYMSPEQAMGDRTLDARSDIYALGCVLYEMLAGEPPHLGNTAQAVVARILTEDADPVRVRRNTVPSNVDAAVQKSLARLPADRFGSVAEFRAALANPAFALANGARSTSRSSDRRVRLAVPLGALAVVLGAAVAFGWGRSSTTDPPHPAVVRFEIPPPDSDGRLQRADVSPDGRRVLLEERSGDGAVHLFLRDLDQLAGTPVPLADPNPRYPIFSPDGSQLAFVSASSRSGFEGKLRVAPVVGGAARTLADFALARPGWGDDGFVYYSAVDSHSGLTRIIRVPASGGTPDTVLKSDSVSFFIPTPLPGSRALLVIVNDHERRSVGVADLKTRTWKSLASSGWWVAYTPGYVLFDRGNALFAAPFDLESLRFGGEPVRIMEVNAPEFGGFHIRGGTLAYLVGVQGDEAVPVLMDRQGRRHPLDGVPPHPVYGEPVVSPDGRKIAFESAPVVGLHPTTDLWVYRLPTGPLNRLTFGDRNENASWTPDGRRILFNSDRGGSAAIWWTPWDGSGQPERVLERIKSWSHKSWLPDGKRFALTVDADSNGFDVAIATVGRPDSIHRVISGPANEQQGVVSPDGRWLAYQSDESGQDEIYLRSIEQDRGKRQLSSHGGRHPVWSRRGDQLYFESLAGDSICALRVDRVGNSMGSVQSLFPIRLPGRGFDVLPGDSLFVVIDAAGAGAERAQPLVVVYNFAAELKARMAAARRSP